MEIELKYLVDDQSKIHRIFNDEELLKIKDKDSDEETQMDAVYFDTEDRRLHREGIAFRVRKEGAKIMGTLKWNGSSEDGMHKREEINVPVDDESKLQDPDIEIFALSEMCDQLKKIVGTRKLIPLMEINFLRKQMRLDTGKSICELSVDVGSVITEKGNEPIAELEIELYSGDEEDMRELGDAISTRFGLIPENKSKFKRGLDLIFQK
ncbi:triphosphatase [Clostridiales Family XIII bacterium PM5-7]